MNKYLIILTVLALLPTACKQIKHSDMDTIPNNTEVTVWRTYNVFYDDGERYEFRPDYELIKSLPVPLKIIIARYTEFLPEYLLNEEDDRNLAQSLGNCATLKEAQQNLLKDRKCENLVVRGKFPAGLQFVETEESLVFKYFEMYGKAVTDKFKIDKNGKISYIPIPESRENIPYSRKTLIEEYECCYRFMLNGEPLEYFRMIFLDGDNVKSIEVNKRDRIVYIEQKNKNPKYLVRSDLASMTDKFAGFKVKSLDEIALISIEDETTLGYFHEFTESHKIEASAVKTIKSYVMQEFDNIKGITVVLKK